MEKLTLGRWRQNAGGPPGVGADQFTLSPLYWWGAFLFAFTERDPPFLSISPPPPFFCPTVLVETIPGDSREPTNRQDATKGKPAELPNDLGGAVGVGPKARRTGGMN